MPAEINESRIRKIRKTAGLSLTAAAALAKRSPTTWRCFEIGGPTAVSADAAEDCNGAVRQMLEMIERGRAA